MEERSQPQSPLEGRAETGRNPEAEARRLIAEFERDSLARRSRLASPGSRVLFRALGLAFLLGLVLGAVWLLLHAHAALPQLLNAGR